METSIDKECTVIGALFQQVINDMKGTAPLWEDFVSKAAKLHTVLKSALSVVGAYLDAFQKIADAATNTKGATKEIGTVLTRICLRHKAVEARLKTFTSALMDCLVVPLHDKMDEWKKTAVNLDKDHAKETKKVRAEVKKRSAEASRWQKKAQKVRSSSQGQSASSLSAAGVEIVRAAEAAQAELSARLNLLQDTEKQALRSALVEERSRFCLFVSFLKPVMSEEMAMMAELSHMEEFLLQLDKHTADPYALPEASEQMISELKGSMDQVTWSIRTPPSSPSSLGSRKSSMCSLGSIQSSSSGSVTPHSQSQMHSPSHGIGQSLAASQQMIRHRSLSQAAGVGVRLSSVSSQDSGFTSQDTLVVRPTSSTPATLSSNQETAQFDCSPSNLVTERPHTISTAYEKGHQRPALSVYTFQPLGESAHQGAVSDPAALRSVAGIPDHSRSASLRRPKEPSVSSQESLYAAAKPPLPQRCSSLERPKVPSKSANRNKEENYAADQSAALPDFHSTVPDMVLPQPLYMNAGEVISGGPEDRNTCESGDHETGSAIYSSLGSSSGYGSHYFDDGQACLCSSCSIPADWKPRPPPVSSKPVLRRPASFAGYADPSSMEPFQNRGQKPFVKRSSLSSFATVHEVTDDRNETTIEDIDLLNLPPPPDFLLESNPVDEENRNGSEHPIRVSEAVKNLSQILQNPVNPDHLRRTRSIRVESNQDSIYCKLEAKEELSVKSNQTIYQTNTVSQLTVNKQKHQGYQSKTLPRESNLQKAATEHLMASLNAKLAQRQHAAESAQSCCSNENNVQQGRRKDPAEVRVVSGLLSQQNFVNCLNATLAKQQDLPRESEVAIRVRQVVAQRCVPDPSVCRESLLDQIRRGTSLRRSRHIDDRSTPRI